MKSLKSMKAFTLLLTAVLPLAACGDDAAPTESEGTTSEDDDDTDPTMTTASTTINPSTTTMDPSTTTMEPTDTDPTTTGETESATEPTTTGETEPTTTGETDSDTESSSSSGGPGDCVEVEIANLAFADTNGTVSFYETTDLNPGVGGADEDTFRIEFYNTDTGSFDLASAGVNDNYQTCAQCVRLFEDFDGADIARQYYQSAGTLDVDATSDLPGAILIGTLTDVTLVEVTIDEEFLSTPVEDGACVDLVSPTDILVIPWNCDPAAYDDGVVCDCGCGTVDPDCADATEASCDECNNEGSCAQEEPDCDLITDDNNATCDVPAAWVCDPTFWNVGDGCDCGCGTWDPDCEDITVASCGFCSGEGSCNLEGFGCPGSIDPETNWTCDILAAWRCPDAAYDDGAVCNCGCDIPDPDCADLDAATCDACNDSGSCAQDDADCGRIITDDNTSCVAPDDFTCDVDFYDAHDGCDCGCGAWDPDCADFSVDACAYCNDTGSCSKEDCPGPIDTDENWLCE